MGGEDREPQPRSLLPPPDRLVLVVSRDHGSGDADLDSLVGPRAAGGLRDNASCSQRPASPRLAGRFSPHRTPLFAAANGYGGMVMRSAPGLLVVAWWWKTAGGNLRARARGAPQVAWRAIRVHWREKSLMPRPSSRPSRVPGTNKKPRWTAEQRQARGRSSRRGKPVPADPPIPAGKSPGRRADGRATSRRDDPTRQRPYQSQREQPDRSSGRARAGTASTPTTRRDRDDRRPGSPHRAAHTDRQPSGNLAAVTGQSPVEAQGVPGIGPNQAHGSDTPSDRMCQQLTR